MIKVKINSHGIDEYITLSEYLAKYHNDPPVGWYDYIDSFVNEGMNINNTDEYEAYLKKLNLKWFCFKEVKILYESLKLTKYSEMFDDDVLRYIAHIYGLGYFERTNYEVDIDNPNLDTFINAKNVFWSNYEKDMLAEDEKYSLMDLLTVKNGMNAIRRELLKHHKW